MIKLIPIFFLLVACQEEAINEEKDLAGPCFMEEGGQSFFEKCLADTGLKKECEYAASKVFCKA